MIFQSPLTRASCIVKSPADLRACVQAREELVDAICKKESRVYQQVRVCSACPKFHGQALKMKDSAPEW